MANLPGTASLLIRNTLPYNHRITHRKENPRDSLRRDGANVFAEGKEYVYGDDDLFDGGIGI